MALELSSSVAEPLSANLQAASDSGDSQELSEKIRKYFEDRKQTEEQFKAKEATRKTIEDVLKSHLGADSRVYMVGSSLTKFATASSVMDIVLTRTTPHYSEESVHRILTSHSGMEIQQLLKEQFVRVPLVRGCDKQRKVQWQLSFNRSENIVKTKLLRAYSYLDDRVAPLVVTIKEWADLKKVKEARDGTLSSYSWTLMLICYLQSTKEHPVLPCLQKQYKTQYGDVSEKAATAVDILESPPAFTSLNTSSLGDLLKGFFDFYLTKFKYDTHAVSVREGGLISKFSVCLRPPRKQWQFICIEELYGDVRTNTARAMFNPGPYNRVVAALREADSQLTRTNTLPIFTS